ncbi:hypothetical protein ACFQ4K_05055 [Tistrella bauzanensis]
MSKFIVPVVALVMGAIGGAATTLVMDRVLAVDPAAQARAGEDMVRDVLIREPELVVDSIRRWQADQKSAEAQAQNTAIAESRDQLVSTTAIRWSARAMRRSPWCSSSTIAAPIAGGRW